MKEIQIPLQTLRQGDAAEAEAVNLRAYGKDSVAAVGNPLPIAALPGGDRLVGYDRRQGRTYYFSERDGALILLGYAADGTFTATGETIATLGNPVTAFASTGDFVVISTADGLSYLHYSDGTYSATLDESKTVIGLIFYLGDPAQDDAALKAEHPECTNGLVMSIIEHNDIWQANANVYMLAIDVYRQMMLSEYPSLLGGTTGWEEGSTLNEMLGYSHTYVMERYTANPSFSDKPIDIFTSLVAFRESNPAPAGTSDWYIPSAKEVFTFIVGEYDDNIIDYLEGTNDRARLLNERLAQVSGADELKIDQSYFMYSSTEVSDDYSYGADQIYGVQSDSGMVLSKSKVAPALYRFILAF